MDQNEKLIKEIELEGFQIKILFCNYNDYLYSSEAVARSCCAKKDVLKTSQNSQENTYVWVSLLIKLQACGM